MRPWLAAGLSLLVTLAPGLAQGPEGSSLTADQVLEVCQQTLGQLEPLFMYT